jgi:hypothetical protein
MVSVDDLWNIEKYNHLRTLRYHEIVEFVFENIKLKNGATRWYFIYNLVNIGILTSLIIYSINLDILNFNTVFKLFLLGFLAGSIAIIPVHEIIHGIGFLMQGASGIQFGADFRQMIFFVASDKFVMDQKAFFRVALSPFAVINLITIFITFFLSAQWTIFTLSFLLFHNIMCIGDFAMVSFFLKHRNRELYTYDDHKERTSFIFEKRMEG